MKPVPVFLLFCQTVFVLSSFHDALILLSHACLYLVPAITLCGPNAHPDHHPVSFLSAYSACLRLQQQEGGSIPPLLLRLAIPVSPSARNHQELTVTAETAVGETKRRSSSLAVHGRGFFLAVLIIPFKRERRNERCARGIRGP